MKRRAQLKGQDWETEALLFLVSEFFRQLGVGLVCTVTIHLASCVWGGDVCVKVSRTLCVARGGSVLISF